MELNQERRLQTEVIYMFDKQLKILIKQQSISVIRLSKATGINAKTLYNYLDGRNPRDLKHVKTLCNYFEVTSDFLLFGSDTINSLKSKSSTSLEELVQFGRYDVYLKKVERG